MIILTANSPYLTYTFLFKKVGRMYYFLSVGVKGLKKIFVLSTLCLQVIELKAKLQDAEHQANCSVKRVEELLQEKRGQYDAMQLAEREFKKARAELEDEVRLGKTRLTQKCEDADELKYQVDALSNEQSRLESKVQQAESRAESLEEDLNRVRDESREKTFDLSKKVADLTAELHALQEAKSQLEQSLNRATEDLHRSDEKLLSASSADHEALLTKQQDFDETVELLQSQVGDLESARSELKAELEESRREATGLIEKLQGSEASLESMKRVHSDEVDALITQLNEANIRCTEMSEKAQKDLENSEEKTKAVERKLNDLLDEKRSLSALFEEKSAEAARLQSTIDELEEARELWRGNSTDARVKAEQQEKDKQELLLERSRLEGEVDAARGELTAAVERATQAETKREQACGEVGFCARIGHFGGPNLQPRSQALSSPAPAWERSLLSR